MPLGLLLMDNRVGRLLPVRLLVQYANSMYWPPTLSAGVSSVSGRALSMTPDNPQRPPVDPPLLALDLGLVTGLAEELPGSQRLDEWLKPGTRIQQYELIRLLGRGGMGSVYLARDVQLGRRVAIKFLQTVDLSLAQRFILEARATARCSHENIVIIHEVGAVHGSPFMVLEFIQGHSLTQLIRGQRVPPPRAVELIAPVVRALICAHAHHIVHRDLKPDNIMVADSGVIKVLDFGIAKVLREREQPVAPSGPRAAPAPAGAEPQVELTRSGSILGTMTYMSPEQWGAGGPVDHRTDIWAVGIMLFRMLAGRAPLEPLRGPQLAVTAALDEPMPRLADAAPDVPPELADVVDRCLRKRKEERFPDAGALLQALEPFLPGRYGRELRVDESPYAGLSSFQESDAKRFFGRAREIAAVVNRLRDRPLLAIVGPSGAGKSSFVRAGLVPYLKRSGEGWEAIVLRPGRNPLAALASLVAPLVGSSPTVEEDLAAQGRLVQRLREEPGYAAAALRSRSRRERRNMLVFVDQFEELYTQVLDPRERAAFTACLASMADDVTSPMRVVLSLRSDFLDRVPEDEGFMAELALGLVFLSPPSREGLRDALVQPAEMAGFRFEDPKTVEHMIDHLEATHGALPLLQFAATRLWEARDPARKLLTRSAYDAMGGVAGALTNHADSVLEKLSTPERSLARELLLRLVTPERTRALVPVEELRELKQDADEIERLMDHLVRARLLVVHTMSGGSGATVELVHESLLSAWPTLRRWLDESQEDASFLEQLRQATRPWQAKGRDPGLLWRGELVEEARRFQRRYRGELPAAQRDFLAAVLLQAERAVRRKRALLAGGAAFLSLLVAASAIALVVIRNAQREAERQAAVAQRAEAAARGAEVEARQHLAEAKAEAEARQRAQQQVEAARADLTAAFQRVQDTNAELEDALRQAQEAQQHTRAAKRRAERHAVEAREARAMAERMLRREQERVKRLEAAVGSIVPELK